jgi:membrane protein DedA with SNARE-associated domain
MSEKSSDPRPSGSTVSLGERLFTVKNLLIVLAFIVACVVGTGAYVVVSDMNAGMTIPQMLEHYGYWLILGWTFVEGESVVIIAGVAAAAGHMKLWLIFLVAWFGSYCGDQLYFAIGKRFGPALLKRYPWAQGPVDHAARLLVKYDAWFILSFRFIYGVRNVTPPALAIAGVSHKRFAVLNFFAAGLWAVAFAGAGYAFGQAFKHVVEDAHKYFAYVILGMFALAVIWGVYHTVKGIIRRRREYAAECAARAAAPRISPGGPNPEPAKRPVSGS